MSVQILNGTLDFLTIQCLLYLNGEGKILVLVTNPNFKLRECQRRLILSKNLVCLSLAINFRTWWV